MAMSARLRLTAGKAAGTAAGGRDRAGDLPLPQPGPPCCLSQLVKIGEPGFQGTVGGPEQAIVAVAFREPGDPSGQTAGLGGPFSGPLMAPLWLGIEQQGYRGPVESGPGRLRA